MADIEQCPDLPNEVAGNFQYISDSSGLIAVTNYGTAGTQEAFTYFAVSGGGSTFTPLATRTTDPNTTTAGAQTTTYAYSFAPGTM